MIKLSLLANKINDLLNAKLAEEKYKIEINRSIYKFLIVADTTDYQPPEREGNNVTFYMQGVLHQTDSNIEASQGGLLSITLNTRLDILVPVFDTNDDAGNKQLVTSVREILDNCFAASGAGNMTDDEGKKYAFSYKYSLVNTGTRAQLPMVGDSFLFTAYINYYFVENGINSQSVKLSINGDVAYTALGINRVSTQEANLPANSTNGSALNTTANTILSINFVAPARKTDGAYLAIKDYLLYGIAGPITVDLTMEGAATPRRDMYISEASINCETVLNASISATLSEAFEG